MADVVLEAPFRHPFPRRGTRPRMKTAAGAEPPGSAPGTTYEGEGTFVGPPASEFRYAASPLRHILAGVWLRNWKSGKAYGFRPEGLEVNPRLFQADYTPHLSLGGFKIHSGELGNLTRRVRSGC